MDETPLTKQADSLFRAGKLSEARALCDQALGANPRDAEALHLRGLILQRDGSALAAIEAFKQAIDINPGAVGYHNNLGVALQDLGRFAEAEAAYRSALHVKPNATHVQNNLKRLLARQGVSPQRTARHRKLSDAEAFNDRGIQLYESGDLDQSLAAFRRAIDLQPSMSNAWNNMGNVLRYLGRLDEAIAAYRRALAIRIDYPDAHQGLGMALLQSGDFLHGWLEYEWRWKVPSAKPRTFPHPRWAGEDVAGKTIFVYEEQGFGDCIQFVRYASLLADRGARIIVGCRRELARLISTVPGVAEIIIGGQVLPRFDLHVPVMSLPLLFDTRLETVPACVPYFKLARDEIQKWRLRVGEDSHFHVGLAWRGNPELATNRIRSINLSSLSCLASVPNITFHNLQNLPRRQSEQSALEMSDHSSLLSDFADTAALISNMNLVITVDTAVAHLAGALGIPTWILIPTASDWRWMILRSDSPWYSTVRLFRQSTPGRWDDVVSQIHRDLASLAP
ncbi:MAG TPA: tetratricopeptide repeat-containing glycosyltransferase family protein [Tepidisphaeraceae bacterium]|jgi:tetratricopeptide (TPR) repeat protein|nr:tetratricopeptide repeat-containing glycosyltransferase family protein [Tepidisphaeraceae bacterium]